MAHSCEVYSISSESHESFFRWLIHSHTFTSIGVSEIAHLHKFPLFPVPFFSFVCLSLVLFENTCSFLVFKCVLFSPTLSTELARRAGAYVLRFDSMRNALILRKKLLCIKEKSSERNNAHESTPPAQKTDTAAKTPSATPISQPEVLSKKQPIQNPRLLHLLLDPPYAPTLHWERNTQPCRVTLTTAATSWTLRQIILPLSESMI